MGLVNHLHNLAASAEARPVSLVAPMAQSANAAAAAMGPRQFVYTAHGRSGEFGGEVPFRSRRRGSTRWRSGVSRLSGRDTISSPPKYSTNALYVGVNAIRYKHPRSSIFSTAIGTHRHIRYLSWAVTAKRPGSPTAGAFNRASAPMSTTTIFH